MEQRYTYTDNETGTNQIQVVVDAIHWIGNKKESKEVFGQIIFGYFTFNR